ncbi:helix-turn-helix domain-containing protein [Paractinoplanes atraurantiacus]|uniref:Uncharacterized protein n=1 Tax=Paractinoplanes atraurantiacus TaxID=1036182 RepID=A0A285KAY2_9ACTN|nr:helix-turn-helix domain-containing protein [Actinoplanes atraurantiacus]SNY69755.1 hypothetical protein SAMN05421748_1363 [Actinoplanes atraurantiacus]
MTYSSLRDRRAQARRQERLVLETIVSRGAKSAPELARELELSSSAVYTILARLESARLVGRVVARPSRRASRAVRYDLDPTAVTVVSVTVSWDSVVAVCADAAGVHRATVTRGRTPDLETELSDLVDKVVADAGADPALIDRIIIGLPRFITASHSVERLRERFPASTRIEAGSAFAFRAAAEGRFGVARDAPSYLMVGADPDVVFASVPAGRRGQVEVTGRRGLLPELAADRPGAGTGNRVDELVTLVSSVALVLDPAVVVVGAELGGGRGAELAATLAARLRELPEPPLVMVSRPALPAAVEGSVATGLDKARDDLLTRMTGRSEI